MNVEYIPLHDGYLLKCAECSWETYVCCIPA